MKSFIINKLTHFSSKHQSKGRETISLYWIPSLFQILYKACQIFMFSSYQPYEDDMIDLTDKKQTNKKTPLTLCGVQYSNQDPRGCSWSD